MRLFTTRLLLPPTYRLALLSWMRLPMTCTFAGWGYNCIMARFPILVNLVVLDHVVAPPDEHALPPVVIDRQPPKRLMELASSTQTPKALLQAPSRRKPSNTR